MLVKREKEQCATKTKRKLAKNKRCATLPQDVQSKASSQQTRRNALQLSRKWPSGLRQEAEDAIEQERRNDLIRQIRNWPVPKLKAKVGVDFFFFFTVHYSRPILTCNTSSPLF